MPGHLAVSCPGRHYVPRSQSRHGMVHRIRSALALVDAKINTLESEGKCSPSSVKSTKLASQFDLQLTRDKQKLNLRAYQLEFRISLTLIVSASSADRENNKRILNAGAE